MQERIVNILLVAVALLAAVLRLIGQKPGSGMTKKQKLMLWRILAATVLLLGLQSLGGAAFDSLGEQPGGCGWLSTWWTTWSLAMISCGRPIKASAMVRCLMKTF